MALIAADLPPRPQLMAQRLIAWAGLRPPMDVEGAARRLGIDVEDLRLSGSVAGLLVREEPKRWLIIVNSRLTEPGRRRFTIAHELGHWALHRPVLRQASTELEGQWEREADEFAAHLLMPRDQVEMHMRMYGTAIIDRHFGVSRAAASHMLRQLGYRVWL